MGLGAGLKHGELCLAVSVPLGPSENWLVLIQRQQFPSSIYF